MASMITCAMRLLELVPPQFRLQEVEGRGNGRILLGDFVSLYPDSRRDTGMHSHAYTARCFSPNVARHCIVKRMMEARRSSGDPSKKIDPLKCDQYIFPSNVCFAFTALEGETVFVHQQSVVDYASLDLTKIIVINLDARSSMEAQRGCRGGGPVIAGEIITLACPQIFPHEFQARLVGADAEGRIAGLPVNCAIRFFFLLNFFSLSLERFNKDAIVHIVDSIPASYTPDDGITIESAYVAHDVQKNITILPMKALAIGSTPFDANDAGDITHREISAILDMSIVVFGKFATCEDVERGEKIHANINPVRIQHRNAWRAYIISEGKTGKSWRARRPPRGMRSKKGVDLGVDCFTASYWRRLHTDMLKRTYVLASTVRVLKILYSQWWAAAYNEQFPLHHCEFAFFCKFICLDRATSVE